MSRPSFEDQMRQILARMREIDTAVIRGSVQRVIEVAHSPGMIPVDTGFLRNSLQAEDGSPSSLAILAWDAKSKLSLTYTAKYGAYVHWGTAGRPGRPWVTLAAQQFPRIAAEVRREVVAAADASSWSPK